VNRRGVQPRDPAQSLVAIEHESRRQRRDHAGAAIAGDAVAQDRGTQLDEVVGSWHHDQKRAVGP
jgi:hypothetical protein